MDFLIQLTDQEEAIAKAYAATHGISLSEAFKTALFEKFDDEIDLKIAKESYAEYLRNPVSYSLDEVMKDNRF